MEIIGGKNSFTKRLKLAHQDWDKINEPVLEHRNMMLSRFASNFFSKDARKSGNHMMNLIDRGVGIILPYLVMSNPRVSVSTRHLQLRHWAYTTELALNNQIEEMDFGLRTLRPAVFNSLFGWGIIKTGIMKSWEVDILGSRYDVGDAYSDVVDDSDFVGDPSAKRVEDMEFYGNNYLMPTHLAKEFFGPKHADHINATFDLHGKHRPDIISKDGTPSTTRFLREYTRFTDYYLPDERVVVTMMTDGDYNKIINTVDYKDSENGPYDILGYKWFPEHPIPIPPVWGWVDMDTIINVIINKMKKQAMRQKENPIYEGRAAGDMEKLATAADGEPIQVNHVKAIDKITLGGVNPDLYNWIMFVDNEWSKQADNAYTMGGRSSQAPTLGQEQLMLGNASRTLDDMEARVYATAKSVLRKHAEFMWDDPLQNQAVVKYIELVGPVQSSFNQIDKVGDFVQYSLDIEPYSMQRLNPGIEYQRMLSFMSQWILPTLPIAAQQGATIDIPSATKDLARKFNLKNIDHWYKQAIPQNVGLNPYQPQVGKMKPNNSGIQDGRTGMQGVPSRNANLQQQQAKSGGQSSANV